MRLATIAIVLAVTGAGRAARALGLPKISVTRTPEAGDCPDAAVLSAATNMLVRRSDPLAGDDVGAPSFDVSFEKGAEGYTAKITSTDGVRVLADPGPTCAALAEAIPLTLALVFDEMSTERPSARAPRKENHGAAGSAPRFSFDAGAGVSVGVVRPAALTLIFGGSWNVTPIVSVGIGALVIPTQSLALGPGAVDVSLLAVGPHACATLLGQGPSVHLAACLEPLIGALSAGGSGFTLNDSATRPWLALLASLDLQGSIAGPVGWFSRAAAAVPTQRESFGIRDVGIAYETPAAAFVGAAGLTLSIW